MAKSDDIDGLTAAMEMAGTLTEAEDRIRRALAVLDAHPRLTETEWRETAFMAFTRAVKCLEAAKYVLRTGRALPPNNPERKPIAPGAQC